MHLITVYKLIQSPQPTRDHNKAPRRRRLSTTRRLLSLGSVTLFLLLYPRLLLAENVSTGHLNDFARLFGSAKRARMEAMLQSLTKNSGIELTVVTVDVTNNFWHPLGFSDQELQNQARTIAAPLREGLPSRHVIFVLIITRKKAYSYLTSTRDLKDVFSGPVLTNIVRPTQRGLERRDFKAPRCGPLKWSSQH